MGALTTTQSVLPWQTNGGSTKATKHDAQKAARKIIFSEAYQSKLEERALAGELPAAVETLLWYYAAGKPPETIALTAVGSQNLEEMSLEELLCLVKNLEEKLREAQEIKEAIPVEYHID